MNKGGESSYRLHWAVILPAIVAAALSSGCREETKNNYPQWDGEWTTGGGDRDTDTGVSTDSDTDVDSAARRNADTESVTAADTDTVVDTDEGSVKDTDAIDTRIPCEFACVANWWDCSLHDGEIQESMLCEGEATCCFYPNGRETDTGEDTTVDTIVDVDTGGEALPVAGLSITKIAVYQSTEIPLMVDWESIVPSEAKVVTGKDVLMRVFVSPRTTWSPRPVEARLVLRSSAVSDGVYLSEERTIAGASTQDRLSSTFNFSIPADMVTADLVYRVALLEVDDVTWGDASDEALWPQTGMVSMFAESSRGSLELVIVPIEYWGDGTGRLPDTGDTVVEAIREKFYVTYPIAREEINVRVAASMPWTSEVNADGTGWTELLAALAYLREDEGAGSQEYYYGLFEPDRSLTTYCRWGCVSGMGYVPQFVNQGVAKAAIGLGFDGATAAETMIHEVGHNHGMGHAPCGEVDGVDPDFPHAGGLIGVWGYDLTEELLKDPHVETDFMGYCQPQWVSDYTYGALQRWIQANNTQLSMRGSVAGEWQALRIDMDGSVHVERVLSLAHPPGGPQRNVYVYDSAATLLETVQGYFIPHSSLPGGLVLFPKPGAAVRFVALDGSPLLSI